MRGKLKNLAGQTVIYGLTNIAGRFINYLLTPLLTGIFEPSSFGIISQMYSYIAILLAILTFGMETSLFNFSRKSHSPEKVFATAQNFVTFLALLFFAFACVFAEPIAVILKYPGRSDYVIMFSLIIVLDAMSAVPLSKLRQLNKPAWFSAANIASVLINFGVVCFFLLYCREAKLSGNESSLVRALYNPDMGVSYVFIANIAGSAVKLLMLLPVQFRSGFSGSFTLLREMLWYASPLAVAAVCYIINEKADIIFLTYMLPETEANQQTGIYAACYKLALFMTIFIQAFRFAAEPFFFSLEKEKDSRETYAVIMHYFILFCLCIFLVISMYVDIFRHFIRNETYWVGLGVVPILLMANLFSGIYQNLSMWYKLSGQTHFGMYFSIVGAALTIGLNVLLIPVLGYYGSAWATLGCYICISIVSYLFAQKYYKIPYRTTSALFYICLSILIYKGFEWLKSDEGGWKNHLTATVGLLIFAATITIREGMFTKLKRTFQRR